MGVVDSNLKVAYVVNAIKEVGSILVGIILIEVASTADRILNDVEEEEAWIIAIGVNQEAYTYFKVAGIIARNLVVVADLQMGISPRDDSCSHLMEYNQEEAFTTTISTVVINAIIAKE